MLSIAQAPAHFGGMRVAAYVRVSSDEQIDGYSLDAQIKLINRWATERDMAVVNTYREEGESAYRGSRTQFRRLIQDAEAKQFDAVVVHKWDRFGRNRAEAVVNKHMLRTKCGVKIFSVSEPGQDDGDGGGMLIEGIMEAYNHFYSWNLGNEIVKAHQEKHERGLHLRHAAYGYKLNERCLDIVEDEAAGVILSFRMYATGTYSYNDIAEALNQRGHRTKTGRNFSKDNVREMLRNPIYVGKVTYQRAAYNPDGSRSFKNEISIRDGQHLPIIDKALFDQVQEIQKKRKHKQGRSNYKPYLLRGLMYCERCADNPPENPLPSWARMYCRQHSTHRTRYVYCDSKHRGHGACGQSGVIADVIEEKLIALLCGLKPGDDWRNKAIEALSGRIGEAGAQKRMEELRDIARKMDYRFDHGFFDPEAYEKEREEIQRQINKLTPLLTVSEELVRAASLLTNFKAHFDACGDDLQKQHELIRTVVERVYIKDEKITRVALTESCELVLSGDDVTYVSHKSGRKGTYTRTYICSNSSQCTFKFVNAGGSRPSLHRLYLSTERAGRYPLVFISLSLQ